MLGGRIDEPLKTVELEFVSPKMLSREYDNNSQSNGKVRLRIANAISIDCGIGTHRPFRWLLPSSTQLESFLYRWRECFMDDLVVAVVASE